MSQHPRVSICIPTYNNERIIRDTLESACRQNYHNKEILVSDDHSTDKTVSIITKHPVRLRINQENLGFTGNFNKLIEHAKGDIIVFLCSDDVFTSIYVIDDIVEKFMKFPTLGVLGRPYYQYIDGHKGAVMVINDMTLSLCNPSGVAFRAEALRGKKVGNKIFTEIPNLAIDCLMSGWDYMFLRYHTIAARLHPSPTGNEACKASYYLTNPQQSMIKNWSDVLGYPFIYGSGLVQIKNRCPQLLWHEIKTCFKLKPTCWMNPGFLFCMLVAIIVPSRILHHLSLFYRHRITRHFVKEIHRG